MLKKRRTGIEELIPVDMFRLSGRRNSTLDRSARSLSDDLCLCHLDGSDSEHAISEETNFLCRSSLCGEYLLCKRTDILCKSRGSL